MFLESFWAHVDVRDNDECWPWQGPCDSSGYGRVSGRHSAHRLAWEIANGLPIPAGLWVLHSCDNRPCVNPAHLRLGTHTDNMRDRAARGRHACSALTHCKHGHPFSGANLFVRWDGARMCRACAVIRNRRYRARLLSGDRS